MKVKSLCASVILLFTFFTAKAKRRYDGLCVSGIPPESIVRHLKQL